MGGVVSMTCREPRSKLERKETFIGTVKWDFEPSATQPYAKACVVGCTENVKPKLLASQSQGLQASQATESLSARQYFPNSRIATHATVKRMPIPGQKEGIQRGGIISNIFDSDLSIHMITAELLLFPERYSIAGNHSESIVVTGELRSYLPDYHRATSFKGHLDFENFISQEGPLSLRLALRCHRAVNMARPSFLAALLSRTVDAIGATCGDAMYNPSKIPATLWIDTGVTAFSCSNTSLVSTDLIRPKMLLHCGDKEANPSEYVYHDGDVLCPFVYHDGLASLPANVCNCGASLQCTDACYEPAKIKFSLYPSAQNAIFTLSLSAALTVGCMISPLLALLHASWQGI
ncbi:hypothetical protein DFH08DRAFT_812318 [Mycena albidolilacea]|uniref:Uncharacterized protein n=1 Tax=Mycena albidolilacea TaxID=1033008 RepID=A0AAD6ZUD4_9AGAR|nr:hypothetical protein DFH08DRAFT_812318 [Mycena albidolilacea]